jgi:hypothetical protein
MVRKYSSLVSGVTLLILIVGGVIASLIVISLIYSKLSDVATSAYITVNYSSYSITKRILLISIINKGNTLFVVPHNIAIIINGNKYNALLINNSLTINPQESVLAFYNLTINENLKPQNYITIYILNLSNEGVLTSSTYITQ